MKRRYLELKSLLSSPFQPSSSSQSEPPKRLLFSAVKERFQLPYTRENFSRDLMAGVIVAMVALPLAMALAIASGVAPQNGIYTVIIAGFLVALLGGSRCQVTGPTAAFVVILAPIVHQFGIEGLLVAGAMAGIILMVLGLTRMGQLIEYIPYPVTTGFTSGIAVVIATIQLKDFFGLSFSFTPEHYWERISALIHAAPTFSWIETSIGLGTLLILIVWPKPFISRWTNDWNKRLPSPLLALLVASVGAALLKNYWTEFQYASIGSRFSYLADGVLKSGIPQSLPHFQWPWAINSDANFHFNLKTIEALLPSAFAIALLGAIESLLSAVVADGMAKTRHDPDSELFALGIANLICPFFGGIAATGAIARTSTNIRFGSNSPISSILHALIVLLVVLIFAPYVSYLPMASLAALLLLVAWNMCELKHFMHIIKVAPLSDAGVLLLCFSLTVLFDMVVGVTVGVGLASLLFMRRMAHMTEAQLVVHRASSSLDAQPSKLGALATQKNSPVLVYKIAGPLFFGATQRAVESLKEISAHSIRCLIFDLSEVPVMDISGLVALENILEQLQSEKRAIWIAGLKPQPMELLERADIFKKFQIHLVPKIEEAIEKAERELASPISA